MRRNSDKLCTFVLYLKVQSHYSVCIAYANFRKRMQISDKLLICTFFEVSNPAYQPQAVTNVWIAYWQRSYNITVMYLYRIKRKSSVSSMCCAYGKRMSNISSIHSHILIHFEHVQKKNWPLRIITQHTLTKLCQRIWNIHEVWLTYPYVNQRVRTYEHMQAWADFKRCIFVVWWSMSWIIMNQRPETLYREVDDRWTGTQVVSRTNFSWNYVIVPGVPALMS